MIAICACTYKRRFGLIKLLESLAKLEIEQDTSIIIVDNDGTDPKMEGVVLNAPLPPRTTIHYFIEPVPGISAARNRAVAEAANLGAEFIAMLDDDEWATPRWLAELTRVQRETQAAVVGGPVKPVFSENRQNLNKLWSLWGVERMVLNGKPFVFCTCNFLARMDAVLSLGNEPFDKAYGITGGGDTVFFRKLFRDGYQMAWADEALLYEDMPDARANLGWLRQRRYRAGNVAVRWELDVPIPPHPSPVVKTLLSLARFPVFPLTGWGRRHPLTGWLLEAERLRGRISAHFGHFYSEYKRPAASGGEKTPTNRE